MVDVPQDSPAHTEISAGRQLQAARERMGLSVREAADGLNLSVAIIEALEADRYEALPPRTFVKGYLRAYAKLVGVKEYDVLAAYEQQQPEPVAEAIPAALASTPKSRGGLGRLKWLVVLVAIVLLGYAGYTAYLMRTSPGDQPAAAAPAEESQPEPAEQQETAEAESAAAETPAAAEPEPVAEEPETVASEPEPVEVVEAPVEAAAVELSPPAADSLLVLEVSGESWIEVEDAAGRRPVAALVQGPQTVRIDGSAPFRLVIGNAEAVQVRYDGEPVSLERHTRRSGVARLTVPLTR